MIQDIDFVRTADFVSPVGIVLNLDVVPSMDFDKLDNLILKKFSFLEDGEKQEIWDWTLEFFPKETTNRERSRNYQKIIRRIKRMSELFEIQENGRDNYILDGERVFFQNKRLPNGLKLCLVVFLQGKWHVHEL